MHQSSPSFLKDIAIQAVGFAGNLLEWLTLSHALPSECIAQL